MKKIGLFLVMLLTMVAFTACSSDDDDEVKVQDTSIVGSWQEDDTTDGTWVWTFKKNGTGYCHVTDPSQKSNPDYTFTFNYTYDGKTLVISGEEDGKTYTDTYVVKVIDSNHVAIYEVDGSYTGYTSTLTRV